MPVYRCPRCKKQFNRKHTYEYHIFEKKFSCTNEPIEYDIDKTDSDNVNNVITIIPDVKLKEKKTKLKKDIKDDDKSQLVSKKFECHKCHNIYSNKSNLNRHMSTHCNGENKIIYSDSIDDNESLYSSRYSTNQDYDHEDYSNQLVDDGIIDNNKSGKKYKEAKKQCQYCKCHYSKTNFSKHEKMCKIKSLEESTVKEEMYISLRNEMNQMKALINKLQSQKTENIISSNINSNNNIQNITNDIKIVAFGKEDLFELIDDETAVKYLSRGYQAVYNLIEDMHFNPNRPEFHSVYISNTQSPYAITYDGDGWITTPKDDVVEQLFDDKACYLNAMFRELKHKLNKTIVDKYSRFMNEINEEEILSIKQDIKRLLYNKNKIPKETRNKIKTYYK